MGPRLEGLRREEPTRYREVVLTSSDRTYNNSWATASAPARVRIARRASNLAQHVDDVGNVVALPQANAAQPEINEPSLRTTDERAQHRDAIVKNAQLGSQFFRRCGVHHRGHQPRTCSRFVETEVNDFIFGRGRKLVEKPDPGRQPFNIRTHLKDHAAEDIVDAIEVLPERRQLGAGRYPGSRDAKIKIDMSVCSNQQMLDYEWPVIGSGLKGNPPTIADWLILAEAFQGGQITVGKSDIKPFHPWPIVENSGRYAFLNLDRDIAVEGGKVAETAAFFPASEDDLIELLKYVVDSLWWRLR